MKPQNRTLLSMFGFLVYFGLGILIIIVKCYTTWPLNHHYAAALFIGAGIVILILGCPQASDYRIRYKNERLKEIIKWQQERECVEKE